MTLSADIAAVLYTVSAVLFILALRGLSSPETSRRGNTFGMVGIAIAIITTAKPIDYGTVNQDKVDVLLFTTGSPNNRQTHLKILAELSRLCLKTDFLYRAREATTNTEIIEAFRECLTEIHG